MAFSSLFRFRPRKRSPFSNDNSIETCIEDVLRRSARLQHLDLQLGWFIAVPSVVFICKTLVVLKLTLVTPKNNFFVDLPLLKILHLNFIRLSDFVVDLRPQFLSGSPNLEYLKVTDAVSSNVEEFHSLPKLVKAKIYTSDVPLEIIKNVKVFVTDKIYKRHLVCDFQNLVQLKFTILEFSEGWLHVLKVLRHFPKLQTLVIRIDGDEEEPVLPYPLTVPTYISLQLKSCCLKDYRGSAFEFQFAAYIMLNANYLRTMKFCIHSDEYDLVSRHHMIRDLSSCSKTSDSCTLSFEKSI